MMSLCRFQTFGSLVRHYAKDCGSKASSPGIKSLFTKMKKPKTMNPKDSLPESLPKSHEVQESSKSKEIIKREKKVCAHNYAPLPVVLCRGEGACVWDADGKIYIDFIAGFSAINHGHCHPRILETLNKQSSVLHHTSRAFYSDQLAPYSEFITKYFGYDKILPMNTGVEGCETSIKIARKWGYKSKKIPPCQAIVVTCDNNFWGRSIAAISSSTDPTAYENYGPYCPGFFNIPYNDAIALEKALKNPCVCAFMVEPIQGEGGVNVPADDYLNKVRELCTKYNVLMIADEVQTGLGRTGKRICCDYNDIKPDILVLGKSLSGGVYPISGVLANDPIMLVIEPGTHGSTFGGNPLACAIATTAINVLEEEGLIQNSFKLGQLFRDGLGVMDKGIVQCIRGKGLFNGILLNTECVEGFDFCLKLMELGLLTRPTHGNIIRFTPPLVITEEQVCQSLDIIKEVVDLARDGKMKKSAH